jgi:predicted unusual protein kinase regulating ubiquinone biosynthesis (AarF/ABC1/UbiB family)
MRDATDTLPTPLLPEADEPRTPEGQRRAPVPRGRTRRLLHLGRAVGEMAAGAAAHGLAQLARGQRPALASLMFTPANARRLAERLSTMRGAAMKVGQLMSMDGHGVLPPVFADLLGQLRDRAHVMPDSQLAEVLITEYGAGWHQRFRRLNFTPIASASIGQVHRVETHDGRVLALKIQHPGVRQSIDSDLANLALLARTPGLVPAGLDLAPLLARVRQQLLDETDYAAEARAVTHYRQRLGDDPVLTVPAVVQEHCTAHILATEFAPGVPIDRLAQHHHPQALRDQAAEALCRLAVREVFQMRLVQTDPNFGNYLFDAASGRIALLDFGATEAIRPARVEHLRALGRALQRDDVAAIAAAALAAGFIGADDPPAQSQGVLAMIRNVGEPLRQSGPYDFGASPLIGEVFAQGQAQYFGAGFARTPPADLLFLQRKFAGTFLLCSRLRARVDVAALFDAPLAARPARQSKP